MRLRAGASTPQFWRPMLFAGVRPDTRYTVVFLLFRSFFQMT
jgi:hypothetical protein